jgi:phosphate transport system permease protein|tara:strand:- start:2246 stop:3556 length:1311 start_codon:yes stop_codon:yes gene_type:complete
MTNIDVLEDKKDKLIAKRYSKEKRFILFGRLAISLTIIFLTILLGSIVLRGISGFTTTTITFDVNLDKKLIDPESTNDKKIISSARWRKITRDSIYNVLNEMNLVMNGEVLSKAEQKSLVRLFSRSSEYQIKDIVMDDLSLIGKTINVTLPAASEVDQFLKGRIDQSLPEDDRPLNNIQISWIKHMVDNDMINRTFNSNLFTKGDSRNAEEAGILGALMGSFFALLICLFISFPLGVMASVYLEEFAPKNRLTDVIEVNINNLAAVPSIVFGLLGLAIFLNVFNLPRSSPLAGGLVLALMTLPTIIISSRAAIKAVPPSIREAAMGLGASKMQSVTHHVLPLAMPGMLTGTIIGLAQALGETAPLLMMGMVAFIVDVPQSITDPATVLPAQIFLWSDQPERGFEEKTAAAIMVLLGFLLTMNALAVFLRNKFERKW